MRQPAEIYWCETINYVYVATLHLVGTCRAQTANPDHLYTVLCVHLPAGPLPSYMDIQYTPSSICTVPHYHVAGWLCFFVFSTEVSPGASYSQGKGGKSVVLKQCRKACLVPDHLNRLASSLVEGLTPDQEDMSSKVEDPGARSSST